MSITDEQLIQVVSKHAQNSVGTRFVLRNPWYPVPQAASGRGSRKETAGSREHAELKRLALTSPTYWDFDIGGPIKLPENCGTGYCSCIECLKPNPKKEKKK